MIFLLHRIDKRTCYPLSHAGWRINMDIFYRQRIFLRLPFLTRKKQQCQKTDGYKGNTTSSETNNLQCTQQVFDNLFQSFRNKLTHKTFPMMYTKDNRHNKDNNCSCVRCLNFFCASGTGFTPKFKTVDGYCISLHWFIQGKGFFDSISTSIRAISYHTNAESQSFPNFEWRQLCNMEA